MISLNAKPHVKQSISTILIIAVILASIAPDIWKPICKGKIVHAETTLKNPIIIEDESMDAGQKVTWDCIYFGSYPQTEIVDKPETSGVYGKKWAQEDDYEVDKETYNKLKTAVDWDENGDITIDGKRYRRISLEDTTFHEKSSEYYEWKNTDNIQYHYFRFDRIKWRILRVNNNSAILLADKALDNQEYNTDYATVSWEKSTIRSWLNGYGSEENTAKKSYLNKNFINTAFSEKMREAFELTCANRQEQDNISLLSKSIVNNHSKGYGFTNDETISDNAKRSKSSTYAKAMGTRSYLNQDVLGNCCWLLRSDDESKYVAQIFSSGNMRYVLVTDDQGYTIDYDRGIRPVIEVNLSDTNLWDYAGTVCSEETQNNSEEIVSNELKYSLDGTYSFGNLNTRIDLKTLKKFFGSAQAYEMYKDKEGTGGQCYGMVVSAIASIVYNSPAVYTYEKNNLYDVKRNTVSSSSQITAKEYVGYAYISQFTAQQEELIKNGETDLDKVYKAIVNNIVNDDEPVCIAIFNKKVGHMLWAIGIGENNEKKTEIIVYDCNYPGEKNSIWLNKENGKYKSWEYKINKTGSEIWGADEKDKELVAYNPTKNFVDQFGENVGYKPIIAGESRLLINVNSMNSKVLSEDGKESILSPEIDDDNITYIRKFEGDSNQISGITKTYSFWADTGNKIKFLSGEQTTDCSIAGDESSVDLSIPENTTADVAVKGEDNSVKLLMKGKGEKYQVSYNVVDEKEKINQITIVGKDATDFNGKQTADGLVVESDSLNNVEIKLSQIDENGENGQFISKDISTDSNRILVNNENDKFTVKEDTNNDGVFDKDVVDIDIKNDKNKKKDVKVSAIQLSGISNKIAIGKKIQLKANISPVNATNKDLTWKTSNKKVATVNNKGVVTINKKAGGKSVIITAMAKDESKKKADFRIKVMKGTVRSVSLTGKKTLNAGKTLKIKAKVKASKGANTKLLWTSSNTKYATVTSAGKVKALKAGKKKTVTITAMATDGSNKKKIFKIKIK